MKKITLIIYIILTLNVPSQAGWFSDTGEQKEQNRREHAEQLLAQQQQTNGKLEIVILALSMSIIGAFVTGAAVGSKARKAVKEAYQ